MSLLQFFEMCALWSPIISLLGAGVIFVHQALKYEPFSMSSEDLLLDQNIRNGIWTLLIYGLFQNLINIIYL